MDVTDEDMQMVREFLVTQEAPFHIQSHFENLLSEYEAAEARVEELQERVDELESEESDETITLESRIADLEQNQDDADGMRGALETVKYWIIDVLVHGRPMQKPPRQILRIVEDAL